MPQAVRILRLAVLILLFPVQQLLVGVVQLLLRVDAALLILRPTVIQLLPGVRQLLLGIRDLLLRVRQLFFRVRDLLFRIGGLLLAVLIIQQAVRVVAPALLVVLHAIGVLRLAVGQLPVSIIQLLFRVRPLTAVLVPAVGQVDLRVLDLAHGVRIDRVVPQPGPPVDGLLDFRLDGIDLLLIGIGICFRRVFHGQEDFVIGLEVKPILRNIYVSGYAPAADGAGPPLKVEVVGRQDQPDDRILPAVQELAGVLVIVGRYGQRAPQVLLAEAAEVAQALVCRLRHPARTQLGNVDALRQGVGLDDGLLPVPGFRQKVRVYRAPGRLNAVQSGKIGHVLLCKAQSGQQPEVKEPLLRQIPDPCSGHGGLAGPQPREKAYAQKHDGQDCQIPPQALPDLPPGAFQQRLYHSIASTGTGAALISSLVTEPFFTWITRSAMAVRALLWVMMTTVMPCWRLMSCKSCKMALPVV